MTEDGLVGWRYWLNEVEFEKIPGDGEGQRSLVCCSPLGCKELVMTERLNNKLCSTNGFSQFSVPMVCMPLHLKIAFVNESFLRMEAPNRS